MMKRFQAMLTSMGVEWVVAPYEADAQVFGRFVEEGDCGPTTLSPVQLAFLSRNGWVDAVITEDSDLLAFGCTRVIFKVGFCSLIF